MIHRFDIETRCANLLWHKTNWGGNDEDVVVARAKQVAEAFRKNQDNPRHVGYRRTGVRVTDGIQILYEDDSSCQSTCN